MKTLAKKHQLTNTLKRLILTFLLIFIGNALPSFAQTPLEKPLSDSAFISLLTASPGNKIYAHYGHSAVRVCDPAKGFDLVFNYGLFDFNSPHFLGRFITGQTDYICGVCSYSDFLIEYQMENRAVTEQVINFLPDEKEAVWQALVKNIQPENRTYRYNFFFDNCATRPRDILVKNIHGTVNYRWNGRYATLRDEVHHFTDNHVWVQFGIDFLLGAQADDYATLSHQQFAPDLLMESFDRAVIDGNTAQARPLVLTTRQPVTIDASQIEGTTRLPGPLLVMWLLFAAVAISTFFELRKGKQCQVLTAVLYAIVGITGSIIAFLVFFSEHPTTHVNYVLLWQHPLHLIYAFGMIFAAFRKKIGPVYLSLNFPLQAFALAGTLFLPQHLHPAMYPLLLCLMLRSGMTAWYLRKKRLHE
jgi:hypothetical protein